MVETFERYTAELTAWERDKILPQVRYMLKERIGKPNAITNKQIVALLQARNLDASEPRVRKIVHELRMDGSLPWLIASGAGYYVAQTIGEMETYVRSLENRANSILAVRDAIRKQMDGTLF